MTRCTIVSCSRERVDGSHWCASHRAMFRQVGGAEPDPLHELIVNARSGHYVMSVKEIATALGCEPYEVRVRLWALRKRDKARPWLPGDTRCAEDGRASQALD